MVSVIVKFQEFRLDPARRELWKGDERLQLPSRVFDCIAYLVEHRDRAVGRDELIAAVWGKTDISDNVLDQTVLRARRVLGDTGEEKRLILTKPRFGYAWVAPTEILTETSRDALQPPSHADKSVSVVSLPTARRWLMFWLPLSMTAAFVIGIALYSLFRGIDFSSSALARTDRALVLPVQVEGSAEQAWIRLGVMDFIAERLRATGQSVVPSDNVVALVKETDTMDAATVERIATAAAATLVLSTRAWPLPDGWRVTLETLRGGDAVVTASGEAPDVLVASRIATDMLAQRLGLPPATATEPPSDVDVDGLLQQVDAALLADEPDVAKKLLERFDAKQRRRSEVRFRSAMIDFRIGRLDAAQGELESLLMNSSGSVFRARILNGLGNVFLRRDDFAAAERSADAAIAILGEGSLSSELGRALTGRAIARSSQNRYQAALADFVRARVVLESIGDRLALARVDTNMGILDARRDRFAEALPVLNAASERLAGFNDLTNELYARVTLAYTHLALLEPAAALAGDARLRELAAREPNAERARYANLARADVLAANGRLAEANAILQRIEDDAEAENDAPVEAWARSIRARMALADGELETALRWADAALRASSLDENPRANARTWFTLVRARHALGMDATQPARGLADWVERASSDVGRIYAALAEAIVAPDSATAELAFARALAAAENGRVPQDLLDVCDTYAQVLIGRGDSARAGEIAARVAGWAERDYGAALLQLRLYHALGQPAAWRAALTHAQSLAGERMIPPTLHTAPGAAGPPMP